VHLADGSIVTSLTQISAGFELQVRVEGEEVIAMVPRASGAYYSVYPPPAAAASPAAVSLPAGASVAASTAAAYLSVNRNFAQDVRDAGAELATSTSTSVHSPLPSSAPLVSV
jgi:hypothetical protein